MAISGFISIYLIWYNIWWNHQYFTYYFNNLSLSEDILGLTIFALGNSIGDFISNYTIVIKPIMAFTACFGGPLLAICSSGLSGW